MRSAEAHGLLAAHDTGLPGLPALLDDTELTERLGQPVTRSYLRYKPGTSAIALVDVGGRAAIAHAWGAAAPDKRAKALLHVATEDVLLDDPARGMLVVDAMADRRLIALQRLVRSQRLGPWLTRLGHEVPVDAMPVTLAHKPARRWVGRLPLASTGQHVILRAYGRREYHAALAAHGLLGTVETVRLPRVLGSHRHGLIALEHLPGSVLDERVDADALRRLGTCLGGLHASAPVREVDAAGVTADPVDRLTPVLGGLPQEVRDVAETAQRALRAGPGTVIHGDFSLDQVVADGHSLGIIDLDRVRLGNPLDDIASLLAAAASTALPESGPGGATRLMDRLRDPLVTGHAATWTAGYTDDLGPRTALALLSRAGEPFRSGLPDWPRVTNDLVTLAGTLASEQVAA